MIRRPRNVRRGLEQRVDHTVRRFSGAFQNKLFDAASTKKLSLAIPRVQNPVTEEHEHIPRLHLEAKLVIIGVVKESQRKSGRLDHMIFPGVDMNGSRQAGIGPSGFDVRHPTLRR